MDTILAAIHRLFKAGRLAACAGGAMAGTDRADRTALPQKRLRGPPAHRRSHHFCYRSAAHLIDVVRTWCGPVHKSFAALPADKAQALEQDLTELLNRLYRAGPA